MDRKLEIKIEMGIALKVAKALLKAGYKLGVNDGEETTIKNSDNLLKISKALFTTDQDHLLVYKSNEEIGWVFLVWGNVEDVVSDYSINLDGIISPIISNIDITVR